MAAVNERLDRPVLSRSTRDELHAITAAIRESDTAHEMMLYVDRYYAFQADIRSLSGVIEGEITAKLGEFRNGENPSSKS